MSAGLQRVSVHYLEGIKSGRESLRRHGLSIASDELRNLKETIKGFGSASPVGQFLRGERDFWKHQVSNPRASYEAGDVVQEVQAESSTPTLQRIGETPQAIFLGLLLGLSILGMSACGNFRPGTHHPVSTMTLPNTQPNCAREHRVQQTGTMGAYGTPVVVVTDEPCRPRR